VRILDAPNDDFETVDVSVVREAAPTSTDCFFFLLGLKKISLLGRDTFPLTLFV